jgi:hypothetical protein
MKVKDKVIKLTKAFGFAYLFLNCMLFIVICIFTVHGKIKMGLTPELSLFVVPLIGMLSGNWIRLGSYGWWRSLIILVSLSCAVAIIFISVFISPKLKHLKQQQLEIHDTMELMGPEVNKMFEALYVDDIKTIEQQLARGCDVNAKNNTGETPLHVSQNKAIVEMLVLQGANVNAVDEYNMTPMFSKDIELTRILVEAGADINQTSYKGNTPLLFYSYSGYTEGIRYLVSLGASVNETNVDGQTAYDIAETFGHFELLDYLKSIGAQSGRKGV